MKQRCKPRYALASADHESLVRSTVELACNPKLKGKVPSAIKEVLANAANLEELAIGLVGFLNPDHYFWRKLIHSTCIMGSLCSMSACCGGCNIGFDA